ncbi:Major Facilitator Superfamily protein [Pyrenophora tritici-repentis]|nr:Major Facilitator Superfamily protein [Pyrenophora tritici-repentis]
MASKHPIASKTTSLIRNRVNGSIAASLAVRDNVVASKDISNDQAQRESASEPHGQITWIILAASCGVFLAAAEKTMTVAIYGKVGSDLNALSHINWLATAYFLTLTVLEPIYGRLSEIFGRKQCLLFAYMCFGFGSLLCGLARDIRQLVTARVIQGIGGGGMTSIVSIIIGELVPLQDRGVWQGKINIIYGFGAAFGAPLGTYSCHHTYTNAKANIF